MSIGPSGGASTPRRSGRTTGAWRGSRTTTTGRTAGPYRRACRSSGYGALKREWNGNRLYAGLNAVQPGAGHQHGDRLNLLTYSRDTMLTGEKRTRYEDEPQRLYSGASYSHNTVTVDETSQVHGNELKGDRIPRIDTFVDLPAAQIAEAHGDRIYEQTRIYHRILCQFDDYL